MHRFWLDSYPPGVAADIDMAGITSVFDFFKASLAQYGDQISYSNFDHGLSYRQLDELSQQFAAYLQNDLGLRKGDRMAIMLPNVLQYPIALFAAMRVGIVVVNVDPLYTSRELIHQLNDSGAKAILFLENFGDVVAQSLPETGVEHAILTRLVDCLLAPKSWVIDFVIRVVKKAVPTFSRQGMVTFKSAMQSGAQSRCEDAQITLDDVLFLQYTGGTTGVSKGAILTHGNLAANILQSQAWIGDNVSAGHERAITALPAYHIFCMTANMLTMMSLGIENILITNPRDFDGFVKILKKNTFHHIIGVNTLFRKLLNTPGFDQVDFSSLRLTLGGGMSITRDVADDWQALTNRPVLEAYGLTETSPAACMTPLNATEFSGSIGLPITSTLVQIKDGNGADVGCDAEGELCIKGPQVTQGYWQNDAANEQAFTADGFFRTGDIATIDCAGFVRILDRKKNMILVSGFNVYPNEIEDVVCQHPQVLEAAAIGVANEDSGEVVKLFVVRDGDTLSEQALMDYCREQLTGYKRPREISFIDEIPKTNVGKISHKDLR